MCILEYIYCGPLSRLVEIIYINYILVEYIYNYNSFFMQPKSIKFCMPQVFSKTYRYAKSF